MHRRITVATCLLTLTSSVPGIGQQLVGVGSAGVFSIDPSTGTCSNVATGAWLEGATDGRGPGEALACAQGNQMLFRIDLTTGTTTEVGSMGVTILQLAYDEGRDVLYGTDWWDLFAIDPDTAETAWIGPLTGPVSGMRALDHDAARDRLMGVAGGVLFEIDRTSGACTEVGPTGVVVHDLWCDAATGEYWATVPPVPQLVQLDPDTGASTWLVDLDQGPMQGLASLSSRELGTSYCTAFPNSTGVAARTRAYGSADLSFGTLVVAAEDVPPNTFGVLFAHQGVGYLPGFGGSQGALCVLGAGALMTGSLTTSGDAGRLVFPLDLTALPVTPTVAVQPGEVWHFQAWFRDANPGPGTNFALPVEVGYL